MKHISIRHVISYKQKVQSDGQASMGNSLMTCFNDGHRMWMTDRPLQWQTSGHFNYLNLKPTSKNDVVGNILTTSWISMKQKLYKVDFGLIGYVMFDCRFPRWLKLEIFNFHNKKKSIGWKSHNTGNTTFFEAHFMLLNSVHWQITWFIKSVALIPAIVNTND